MKKQELIEKLKAAGTVSSNVFIPVSDVISMVEELEESEVYGISKEDIDSISEDIASRIYNEIEMIIDEFEISTSVYGNEITVDLETVTLDKSNLKSIIENTMEDTLNNK